MAGDMTMTVALGQLEVSFTSEGTSFSPDVAVDLVKRTGEAFTSALIAAKSIGIDIHRQPVVLADEDTDDEADG